MNKRNFPFFQLLFYFLTNNVSAVGYEFEAKLCMELMPLLSFTYRSFLISQHSYYCILFINCVLVPLVVGEII